MATPISSVNYANYGTSSAAASEKTSNGTGSADIKKTDAATEGLANKETFLKLLVAQIKNQNPLNPTDGMEFVSQLAQFSQLEQAIGLKEELASLHADVNKALGIQAEGETKD